MAQKNKNTIPNEVPTFVLNADLKKLAEEAEKKKKGK